MQFPFIYFFRLFLARTNFDHIKPKKKKPNKKSKPKPKYTKQIRNWKSYAITSTIHETTNYNNNNKQQQMQMKRNPFNRKNNYTHETENDDYYLNETQKKTVNTIEPNKKKLHAKIAQPYVE